MHHFIGENLQYNIVGSQHLKRKQFPKKHIMAIHSKNLTFTHSNEHKHSTIIEKMKFIIL